MALTDREYKLKIDEQTQAFLDAKQKLTYFLVTASAAVIVFLAEFALDRLADRADPVLIWPVVVSCVFGLLVAAFALLNLYNEHGSHRLHIKYSYEGKEWEELCDCKRKEWTRLNQWARMFLKAAFACLLLEMLFAVLSFLLFFQTPHMNLPN